MIFEIWTFYRFIKYVKQIKNYRQDKSRAETLSDFHVLKGQISTPLFCTGIPDKNI